MIIVTHEMSFARDVADQVIFMDGGVVVEEGTPEAVFGNPQQERTRQFLEKYRGIDPKEKSPVVGPEAIFADTKERAPGKALSLSVRSKLHSIHRPQVHRARHGQPLELPALGDGGDLQGSPRLAEGPGLAAFPAAQGLQGRRLPPPAAHRRGWVRAASWAVHRAVSGSGPGSPRPAGRLRGAPSPGPGPGGRGPRRPPRAARPPFAAPTPPRGRGGGPPAPLAGLHLGRGKSRVALAGEGIDLGGEGLRPPVSLHRHLALPADLPGHGEGEGGLGWRDLPPQTAAAASTRTTPPGWGR